MAPKYKLTYFDIKGLGECIKYIFAYKNIEYELETVILFTGEGPWWDIKSSMPFGQLPVLDVEGHGRLYQSQAICHYLAEEHGLKTGDAFVDAQLMALANTIFDVVLRVAHYYYIKEPVEKEKLRLDRENNVLPFYLSRFENILKEKGGYFNKKVTWVDFYVVAALETINGMMGRDLITDKYPQIESLIARVQNLPGVKEYIEKRPPHNR